MCAGCWVRCEWYEHRENKISNFDKESAEGERNINCSQSWWHSCSTKKMSQKSHSSSSATKSSNPPASLKLYALPLRWLSGLTVHILHKPTSLTYWVQPLSNQGLSSCNYLLSVLSHYIMFAPIFCISDIIIKASYTVYQSQFHLSTLYLPSPPSALLSAS